MARQRLSNSSDGSHGYCYFYAQIILHFIRRTDLSSVKLWLIIKLI